MSQDRTVNQPLPLPLISIRDKQCVSFVQGPFDGDFKGERVGCLVENTQSDVAYSSNGEYVCVSTKAGIKVYSCGAKLVNDAYVNEMELVQTLDYLTARHVEMSPCGNFVVSFEPLHKEVKYNHIVWSVKTGEALIRVSQGINVQTAPHKLVQWTLDGKYMLFLQAGELAVYDTASDFTAPVGRVNLAKLYTFQLAPQHEDDHFIALYSPVHGNAPAKIMVYLLNDIIRGKSVVPGTAPKPSDIATGRAKSTDTGKLTSLAPTTSLSFFKATECHFQWHCSGLYLLARTACEDQSGQSYYADSRLYFLHGDNSFNCNVSFGANKGVVFDAVFSPRHLEFCVLQGEARSAKATLWTIKNKTCEPIKEFGSGAWNMIKYAPQGRFVTFAGFGSLSGRIDIFDKYKLICLASFQDIESPKTLEWSPCGRYFTTATLFPWLRVANVFKVYAYDGTVKYREVPNTVILNNEEHFCQVKYRPSLAAYPDLPAEPHVLDKAQKITSQISSGAAPPAAKPSYVPPHLRGKQGEADNKPKPQQQQQASGPRDLQKERKKGSLAEDIGGAGKIVQEEYVPQAKKAEPALSWRR